jgi:threonine dehydrogenase-like Zn-dependent dehydrogenase
MKMRAVVFDLSIPKYLAAKALGGFLPMLYDGAPSCLSFRDDVARPARPGDDWLRLKPIATGVCGSDLGFVYFKSSPTISPYGSSPFVPGHEILAVVTEVGRKVSGFKEGDRVCVDPFLSCEIRGVPDCGRCEEGEYGTCERHGTGPKRGMMLGACAELPGGWCEEMLAHESQLFAVPDSVGDDRAVLMEPMAIASHAILRNRPAPGERLLVLGGGPIAFCTLVMLRELVPDADVTLFTIEKHQADIATLLGATRAWTPEGEPLVERAARLTGAAVLEPELGPSFLAGGFDRSFDCVGSATSLRDAMGLSRAGGTVVMVGAAGVLPRLDLSHLWSKELNLVGTLAYGHEDYRGRRRRTFDITRELLEGTELPVERLVTHHFGLESYQDALRANLDRSKTGAIKTVITV